MKVGQKRRDSKGLNESKDVKKIFSGRKGGLSGPVISSLRACVLSLNSRHKEVTLPSASQQSISITALDVTRGGTEEEGVLFMGWVVGVKPTLFLKFLSSCEKEV